MKNGVFLPNLSWKGKLAVWRQPKRDVIIPKNKIAIKISGKGSPSRKVSAKNGILASITTVPLVIKQTMQIKSVKQTISEAIKEVFWICFGVKPNPLSAKIK